MSVRDEARIDWQNGIRYKDIATKYGVSENTIKSWASRYWKNNNNQKAATELKKLQPSFKKLQPQENSSESVVKAMANAVDENTELTDKQKDFCVRFMQNRNATQAYLKAYGCSYATANTSGPALLVNPRIQNELKKLREIKNSALGCLCGEDIVEMHMRIAFADITDFVEFDEQGINVKNGAYVDGTLLTEISEGRNGVKIKLADKMKSLQFLERYFELNPNDRHRHDFDKVRLEIEKEKLALIREKDDAEENNNLLEKINEVTKGDVDTDDIPELQQEAEADDDVVE